MASKTLCSVAQTFPSNKPFLQALQGNICDTPPIWLMRQAGRYLPEYRDIRSKAGSFFNLCYSPELAAEVTLQPIRRFGFDAAILFSDILVVPNALGQNVRFVEGEGPRLEPIRNAQAVDSLNPLQIHDTFSKVYETVSRLRENLPEQTALIGFCGAPWTVATYMVGGRGSLDQAETRLFAYRDEETFERLIRLLVDVSVTYLAGQIDSGAEVVQIFDSWAGNLPEDEFLRWVVEPTAKMVHQLKTKYPSVPIIGFPRGAGSRYVTYVKETGVCAVSCDTSLPLAFMRNELQNKVPVQGNLDPLLLVSGGKKLDARVDEILEVLGDGPFIFNLGHGIVPQTPPENVGYLVNRIRGEIV